MAKPITSWPEAQSRRDNDGRPTAHLYNWQKNRLAARARQLDITRLESLTMPSALNNYAKASAMSAAWPAFLDMSDDERDYALDLCATWLRDARVNEWYRDPASLPWDESHYPDPATLRSADRHALRRRGSGGENGHNRGRREDGGRHGRGQDGRSGEQIQDRGRREDVDRQDRGQERRSGEHVQGRGRREDVGGHGSGQERGSRENVDTQDRGQEHRWGEHVQSYTRWDHRREHTMEDSAEPSSQDSVQRLGEGSDRSQVGVGERSYLDEDDDEDDHANATASRSASESNLSHSSNTAKLHQQHAQTDSQTPLKFRLPACTTSQGIELPAGTIVSYIRDSSGGWAKVETDDAKRHWVARGLLRTVQ